MRQRREEVYNDSDSDDDDDHDIHNNNNMDEELLLQLPVVETGRTDEKCLSGASTRVGDHQVLRKGEESEAGQTVHLWPPDLAASFTKTPQSSRPVGDDNDDIGAGKMSPTSASTPRRR